MNNRAGIGVFGTFGEPNGYQQVFYYDVGYTGSLDLDEDEIEFYAGNDLYAVRREMVDGVYTVCFCIYSYVRELNTERFGTFAGSAVVLQEGYAEADYIYRALRDLNDSLLKNAANVENNILVAQAAADLVVKESEELIALRANTIPISKTPFFSAAVHEGRKYFVTPNPLSEDTREQQIVNFFDKALKDYNDTDSLYFSFDRSVYEFVSKARTLEVRDWDEFMEHLSETPADAIVLSKKGIQKPPPGFATDDKEETIKMATTAPQQSGEPSLPKQTARPEPQAAQRDEDDDDGDDDPFKPFNLWDDPVPPRGWNQDEAKTRVREYNRLFKYTNTLLEHINEPANDGDRRRDKKRKQRDEQIALEDAVDEVNGETKKTRRRPPFWLLLIGLVTVGGVAVFLMNDDGEVITAGKTTVTETPAAVQDPAMVENEPKPADSAHAEVSENKVPQPENEITPMQPIARVPTATAAPANTAPATPVPAPAPAAPVKTAPLLGTVATQAEPATGNPLMLKESAIYQKAHYLHPRPNLEMTQNDIAILKEMGIKNKTLSELTRMLYENVPSNIGNIYKGQELEYGAALLSSNRQAFKLYGSEYVCINDAAALRIPAYKSPRLPAVYPK